MAGEYDLLDGTQYPPKCDAPPIPGVEAAQVGLKDSNFLDFWLYLVGWGYKPACILDGGDASQMQR